MRCLFVRQPLKAKAGQKALEIDVADRGGLQHIGEQRIDRDRGRGRRAEQFIRRQSPRPSWRARASCLAERRIHGRQHGANAGKVINSCGAPD